jgi:anti-sigma regulatory factor (Ser/Thr protein kinase)
MEANLLERPVSGSAVLELLPVTTQPHAARSGVLPVAPIAAALARDESKEFLKSCDVSADLIEVTALLISELVTNAYNAMNSRKRFTPIEFSLRLFTDRLLIEVLDWSPEPPVVGKPEDDDEGGRGLQTVVALTQELGYFRHQHKKVVYCILSRTTGEES